MKRLLLFALSISASVLWGSATHAQPVDACQVPASEQYSLLVNGQTTDEQNRLAQVLPSSATITPCVYGNQRVIQVSTFDDEALAESWAEYLTTVEGFQTVVLSSEGLPESDGTQEPSNSAEPMQSSQATPSNFPRPTTAPSGNAPSSPSSPSANVPNSSGRPQAPAYAPAVLEPGYAVLVRYNNQPEVAAAVRAVLSSPVGLAVYEQQPYLLVAYSPDPAIAGRVLQGLSDRQFNAFIVSSQQVVVLSSSVAVPQ
ncbi:MAG: hypothetical protein VKL39_14590 [Leptolyngbyaceae bacterium]|nr:hypothetical protein [Leptolyngbyaceae bacterium]